MKHSTWFSLKNVSWLAWCFAGWMSIGCSYGIEYFVAQAGQTPSDFRSWGGAASNIQAAVDMAVDSDIVWVGAGHYTLPSNPTNYYGTNVVYIGRSITLRGATGNPADVIVDGENAYRPLVVRITTTTTKPVVLDGLTFCNGLATNYGGGIMLADPADWAEYKVIIQNCIVRDNTVAWGTQATGGGICVSPYMKDVVISNCVLSGNIAESSGSSRSLGGAVSSTTGNPGPALRLIECQVMNNVAGEGGGIYGNMVALFLDRCTFHDNRALLRYGGAVFLENPMKPCYTRHCLFYNNVAASDGGAIYWSRKQPLILDHCTIVSNWSSSAAITLGTPDEPSGLILNNTILHRNHPAEITGNPLTNLYATNSCVGSLANLNATDCFTDDPGFQNFEKQDFRLAASSLCVNAGRPLAWVTAATLDLADNPRVDRLSGIADIGCFERTNAGTLLQIR